MYFVNGTVQCYVDANQAAAPQEFSGHATD